MKESPQPQIRVRERHELRPSVDMSVDAADVGVCATLFAEPSFYHELRSLGIVATGYPKTEDGGLGDPEVIGNRHEDRIRQRPCVERNPVVLHDRRVYITTVRLTTHGRAATDCSSISYDCFSLAAI